MKFLTICAATVLHSAYVAAASGLFDLFTQCKQSDNICQQQAIQKGVDKYAHTGIPEFHLYKFDPLHIAEIKSQANDKSPFNVDLTFQNLDISGLANLKLLHMSPLDVILKKTVLEVEIPKLLLKGLYEIHGNILILPITGKGKTNILLENNRARITLFFQDLPEDSPDYGSLREVKIQLIPKRAVYKLEGLFNGNKELSDSMHAVLNENSLDIFNEIAPNIKRAVGVVIKDLLNEFFAYNNYTKLLLEN